MLSKFVVRLRVKSKKRSGSRTYSRVFVAPNRDVAIRKAQQRVARLKGVSALDPERVLETEVVEVEQDVGEERPHI